MRKQHKEDMAVWEERVVRLGGHDQVISLEGKRRELPVMIMFHGGPWGPIIYGMAYRGYYPQLAEHFILVWWDQYGCGKNYDPAVPETLTVSDFADMAVELVDVIAASFPKNELYLNGNSFGSYLSMTAASRRQDLVTGVINVGPIMDMPHAPENFLHACAGRLTPKEKATLDAMRGKDYIHYDLRLETLAEKYTNCAHYKGRESSDALTAKWALRLLTSPDYRLRDIVGVLKAYSTLGKRFLPMWNSLGKIDLWDIAETLPLPMLYLQGSEELYVLPAELEALAQRRGNVTYRKIPFCGHIPTVEGWDRMVQAMLAFPAEVQRRRHG